MKKITLNQNKLHLEDEIVEVLERDVKPIGSGAMVLVPKKYIGKRVYVLIAKE